MAYIGRSICFRGLPSDGASDFTKNLYQCRNLEDIGLSPGVRDAWREGMATLSNILALETLHGQGWNGLIVFMVLKELDTTEKLSRHAGICLGISSCECSCFSNRKRKDNKNYWSHFIKLTPNVKKETKYDTLKYRSFPNDDCYF